LRRPSRPPQRLSQPELFERTRVCDPNILDIMPDSIDFFRVVIHSSLCGYIARFGCQSQIRTFGRERFDFCFAGGDLAGKLFCDTRPITSAGCCLLSLSLKTLCILSVL
jgi:hypothetical protein